MKAFIITRSCGQDELYSFIALAEDITTLPEEYDLIDNFYHIQELPTHAIAEVDGRTVLTLCTEEECNYIAWENSTNTNTVA